DFYSTDEEYDIDAQIMAMEALGHYPYDSQEISEEEEDDDEMDEDDDEPPPLWEASMGYISAEEEDSEEEADDDDDEDEDEDEGESLIETSDPMLPPDSDD